VVEPRRRPAQAARYRSEGGPGVGAITLRLDRTEAWSLPELIPHLARG
jgi:hypothetical protein